MHKNNACEQNNMQRKKTVQEQGAVHSESQHARGLTHLARGGFWVPFWAQLGAEGVAKSTFLL